MATPDLQPFHPAPKPLLYKPAIVLLPVLVAALCCSFSAQAQIFQVIYSFTGSIDGAFPRAGLTMNRAGDLYGTAETGGYYQNGYYCELFGPNNPGCGTVFQVLNNHGAWTFNSLYNFHLTDGAYPTTPVTFGPNGNLYGSTSLGDSCGGFGCGTVFSIRPSITPPPTLQSFWTESAFFGFDNVDSAYPSALVFDHAGNIYGTTATGGIPGAGIVFELTPNGKSWTEDVLYTFTGGADGASPNGVIFDSAGNLFGATSQGGNEGCAPFQGCGTIFELTPSGSGWTKTTIHTFDPNTEGGGPHGVLLDASGNLYGTTSGDINPGIVWQMMRLNGQWSFNVLHQFTGLTNNGGPRGPLVMDAAGALYGVTNSLGVFNYGNVFKLTRSGASWTYTDLYDFQGGSDGCYPEGSVTLDSSGDIFGTTRTCGLTGYHAFGTIYEITP